jgi:hypothetical protein
VIRSRAAALLLAACATGCAAENAAAPAPVVTAAPEPSTVEEAQAQLARAHAQVGGAPSDALHADSSGGAGGAADEATTKSSEQPVEGDTRKSPCAVACNAIASMKRAVDAICRMTGEADPRCLEARKTLADDDAKVARCSCR